MAARLVVIGRIVRPHGVRGDVRVRTSTESPESGLRYRQVYFRQPGQPARLVQVIESQGHQGDLLFKLKGITTRDQAQELVGTEVLIERAWLPELEADEFYWADLIGLMAYDQNGLELGQIRDLLPTAGGDILVVDHHGREVLLPFNVEVILEVDLAGGRLLVSPPEGLLEL